MKTGHLKPVKTGQIIPRLTTAVFAAAGLRPFAQMAFVTAAARASAAPTGPGGPDGHLANTTNVIRQNAEGIG